MASGMYTGLVVRWSACGALIEMMPDGSAKTELPACSSSRIRLVKLIRLPPSTFTEVNWKSLHDGIMPDGEGSHSRTEPETFF